MDQQIAGILAESCPKGLNDLNHQASPEEIQRKQRAIFELETWHVAVDLRVADELLALRRGSCVHGDTGRSLCVVHRLSCSVIIVSLLFRTMELGHGI